VARWAQGSSWSEVIGNTSLDEGDVVRVLRRTVDLLAQIPYCEAISDQLRRNARRALRAINRFPVCEVEDLLGPSAAAQDEPDEEQQPTDAHDGVDRVGVGSPGHGPAGVEGSVRRMEGQPDGAESGSRAAG
jgi:hypothetical protein